MGSAKSICSSNFTEEALKTLLYIKTLGCRVRIADVALSARNDTRMFRIISVCLLNHTWQLLLGYAARDPYWGAKKYNVKMYINTSYPSTVSTTILVQFKQKTSLNPLFIRMTDKCHHQAFVHK